jgi:hypothetical protein
LVADANSRHQPHVIRCIVSGWHAVGDRLHTCYARK